MTYFVLTFLIFTSIAEPVVASRPFETRAACEATEGDALTAAYNDDTVTGWIIVDDCKEVGGKATKG